MSVPGSFRRLILAAMLAGVLAVSGCGSSPPEVRPDPVPAVPPPAVTETQTGRILDQLGGQLEASEASGSWEQATRMSGVASEMFAAQAAMRGADPDGAPADQLATQFAGIIVPATTEWPRTFAAVTSPTDLGAQYVYALTQPDPRSPYAMTSWVRLLAGVTIPETAPAGTGSPVLDVQAEGDLLLAPEAALAIYAEAKDNPASPAAATFTGSDPARDAWAGLVERWGGALAPIEGQVGPSSSVDTSGTYALGAADGGAIVFGIVRSTLALTIPSAQGRSFTLADYFAALGAASTTVTKAATIEFVQPVALAIPAKASGASIEVLGVSQLPVHATTE
ncbi:MAG: hypothetical protein LBK72_05710 [Bifidobacteriaceae bacterium]|jgi:hypothetical protein|nr:hypothetical protein [Bifidobacteriaceae bacterium]